MQTILNTPDDPAHDSLVEKKSEFIGDAAHVDTLDEALAFVAAIREQHPKARHVALPSPDISVVFCWAPVGWSARTHPPHHWR